MVVVLIKKERSSCASGPNIWNTIVPARKPTSWAIRQSITKFSSKIHHICQGICEQSTYPHTHMRASRPKNNIDGLSWYGLWLCRVHATWLSETARCIDRDSTSVAPESTTNLLRDRYLRLLVTRLCNKEQIIFCRAKCKWRIHAFVSQDVWRRSSLGKPFVRAKSLHGWKNRCVLASCDRY